MSKFDAIDGPAACCAFCEDEMPGDAAEAEVSLMTDYVDTNLEDEPPGYRVGLCVYHLQLLQRATKVDGTELVVR